MKIFFNNVFKNYFIMMISIFISEIIFRLVLNISIIDFSTLRIFIGINIISLLLSVIFSFLGRIGSNILSILIILVTTIYAIIEAGFYNLLGQFMSFNLLSELNNVMDFSSDYFNSFSYSNLFIGIPIIFVLIFYIFFDHRLKLLERNDEINFADKFDSEERKKLDDSNLAKKKKSARLTSKINGFIIAVGLSVLYYFLLSASFMQNSLQLYTLKETINDPSNPSLAINQYGYTAYSIIDLKSKLSTKIPSMKTSYDKDYTKEDNSTNDYSRLMDDTNWEEIIKNETNSNYKKLNNYFISQEITDENDFTGIFKNKNLIVIMLDSTNDIILDEDYYPNISKLYNEGWSWDNNYSPMNTCSTGNNEFSGMTSLYTMNNICTVNKYKNNVYPESLFNLFNDAGYTTSSYHNYTDLYYSRSITHVNLGSGHYYNAEELGIPYSSEYAEWPSDKDLVLKMLEETEDEEKFMVWLTTVSAHQPYDESSTLGDKYLDLFSDTIYNTSLKRYMSKLKETDDAIGELLDGLTEQGKLDDTVIVIYSSHYPYALSNNTLNNYFDYDVNENNNVDKTPFIIYNSEMSANKYTEYTSYINIAPTILNLFDLDYDPRLYLGHDLLDSKYENRVYFSDGSWQDSKAIYNASTGNITYINPANTYTDKEIKEINEGIKIKLYMSSLAIKTNYFNYLKEAEDNLKVTNVDSN